MKIAIVAVKKGKCLCGQSEVSYASKAEANCYTVEPSLWMGGGVDGIVAAYLMILWHDRRPLRL